MSAESSDLAAALVGGAVVAIGHVFTLLRGHYSVERQVKELSRRLELVCERLGIDIASGPHVIDRKKDQ